jgi:hypothetical protein
MLSAMCYAMCYAICYAICSAMLYVMICVIFVKLCHILTSIHGHGRFFVNTILDDDPDVILLQVPVPSHAHLLMLDVSCLYDVRWL